MEKERKEKVFFAAVTKRKERKMRWDKDDDAKICCALKKEKKRKRGEEEVSKTGEKVEEISLFIRQTKRNIEWKFYKRDSSGAAAQLLFWR